MSGICSRSVTGLSFSSHDQHRRGGARGTRWGGRFGRTTSVRAHRTLRPDDLVLRRGRDPGLAPDAAPADERRPVVRVRRVLAGGGGRRRLRHPPQRTTTPRGVAALRPRPRPLRGRRRRLRRRRSAPSAGPTATPSPTSSTSPRTPCSRWHSSSSRGHDSTARRCSTAASSRSRSRRSSGSG